MDTFKLKLLTASMFFLVSQSAHSELFDMSQHSGIIKDSSGNFYKVNSAGTVSAIKSGTNLSLIEKVPVPTSKGFFSVELARNVPVEVSRVGKAVRGLSLLGGPVGLSITAVSLVCELTDICNVNGEWIKGADPAVSGYPQTINTIGFYYVAGLAAYSAPTPDVACSNGASKHNFWGPGFTGSGSGVGPDACTVTKTADGTTFKTAIQFSTGTCPEHYSVSGSTCILSGNPESHPATAEDWNSAESSLNDERFIDELLDKAAPVPVGNPTIPAPVSVPIGSSTKTTKDANGNVTGTETTTSEATISEPTSGENPSGSPTIIKIVENHTTNNYNTNNELIGSTTTTTGGTAKPEQQQQSFEIEIDNIEANPLQERAVPFPFETDSWGSGSCPSDRQVDYHYGSLNLTFQPACQFAEGIKPIVLILSGFIAMFIIMGGTKDAN